MAALMFVLRQHFFHIGRNPLSVKGQVRYPHMNSGSRENQSSRRKTLGNEETKLSKKKGSSGGERDFSTDGCVRMDLLHCAAKEVAG